MQVALGRKTLFGGQGAAVISVHASVKMSQQAPMEGVQVVGVQTPVAMLVPPASWQICGSRRTHRLQQQQALSGRGQGAALHGAFGKNRPPIWLHRL